MPRVDAVTIAQVLRDVLKNEDEQNSNEIRVYNELRRRKKPKSPRRSNGRKRGYCPIENEGKLMYCNRSWSKAVYFRANQVRRMSEMELALIRRRQKKKTGNIAGSERK